MAIKLKTAQFCSLSKELEFKSWLKDNATDLYDTLLNVQKKGSCKSNSTYMLTVYSELFKRGKGDDLEAFIKRRYPSIIDEDIDRNAKSVPSSTIPPPNKVVQPQINPEVMNKHKVFRSYKPNLLTFPLKKIVYNPNPQQLLAIVNEFIANKISTDYIIIEDRAYIEYFESKHANIADRIPKNKREIYQYRLKMQQHAP